MKSLYPRFFTYTDHLRLLQYIFKQVKKENPNFTHRYFALKGGYSSPSVLKDVLNGRKKVPLRTLPRFLKPFKLSQKEQAYFILLAQYDLAKNNEDRMHLFRELIKYRRVFKAREITKDQYGFFKKWYYGVVRELAGTKGFKADPKWIADRVAPTITTAEAKEALELLFKYGFLVKDADGKVRQAEPRLNVAENAPIPDLKNLVKQMVEIEWGAIDDFGPEERLRLGLNMHMSGACYKKVMEKLKDIQQEILDDVSKCPDEAEMVCHLGLGLYPLVKTDKRTGR